jgi:molybdopterin/thiamine biosynthesis adenylyltransferase
MDDNNNNKIVADHWRGLDFYKPSSDRYSHAIIVGCGAIGSYAAFGLARMGVKKLTLIDYDVVEPHNLPNQFFAESLNLTKDLLKTSVLASTIKLMVKNVVIEEIPLKWEEIEDYYKLSQATAIITAVDKMEIREMIFDNEFVNNYCQYLLDSRTGGLYARIFAINMAVQQQKDYYKSTLHSNEEAAPLPCSGQSIVDTSMAVSAELIGRYRSLVMKGFHPTLETFHDYSTGTGWVQQVDKDNIKNCLSVDTSEENIDKIGSEPQNTEPRNG